MSQLPFHLPHKPVFAEENFVISDCNREAYQWIMSWPKWPTHALLLYGDSGAGKSHLGHIWAVRAKATTLPIEPSQLSGNALLEHIEGIDEKTLLHLLNIAKEKKYFLLLSANNAPKELPFSLPDLTSRLLALPAAHILSPDEAALESALRKQFADRQLKVEEEVIVYITTRMERSFARLTELVEKLDRASLAEGRNITIPFVKRVTSY
jgi:chromosomal replication initiation ATPase DnaA